MSLFSENLKDIRNKANISRKEIAEKIGVTLVAYGNYEKGDREPRLDTLVKIASVLQCSVDDLLSYKPNVDETQLITNELEKMGINFKIDNNKIFFRAKGKQSVLSLFTNNNTSKDICDFVMVMDDFKELYKTLKITYEQSDSYREGFKNLLLMAIQEEFLFSLHDMLLEKQIKTTKSRPQS